MNGKAADWVTICKYYIQKQYCRSSMKEMRESKW